MLGHLEQHGFAGAPRFLGVDEADRDSFSFLPGDVPAELAEYSDEVVEAAARLIRGFHDATVPLVQSAAAVRAGIEVVCHNDLSPCNAVFRDRIPVALIDFDSASPGTRAFDLAYAAWLWLDWGNSDWTAAEQRRRLRLFLAAYGPGPTEFDVIQSAVHRQAIVMAQGVRAGDAGVTAWAADCRKWTLAHLR